MRATLLLAALLTTTLAPVATAHEDMPDPPLFQEDPGPCPQLPLWDAATCYADRATDAAELMEAWAFDMADWSGHLVRCDVVGGPVCDPRR